MAEASIGGAPRIEASVFRVRETRTYSPFSSTESTTAVAAGIGLVAERKGPIPRPSRVTGSPALPALSVTLAIVIGRRLVILNVVLPGERRVGVTLTKARARAC